MQKIRSENILTRDFYLRDANQVAIDLLGKLLVHCSTEGMTAGIIVEVEAYVGPEDKGAHSYMRKRTKRTEVQFGLGGYAYIYSIYGIHSCFNVVTNVKDKPEVVLVRAIEPVYGIELMKKRRETNTIFNLCNGPGKLCQAMGITKEQYGYDLCRPDLFIASYQPTSIKDILISPRINIDYAEECRDYLWRYYLKENPYVSKVPRRYNIHQQELRAQIPF